MKLSVVIITLNEEHNIERCIKSVRAVADEILVVDSYSKDYTVGLARFWGAKVIFRPFDDYVSQKNFATDQASNDWILSIDADEVLSNKLILSIRKAKTTSDFSFYYCKRRSNYCGKWIRFCGWYPDKKIRLFDRTTGKWRGRKIHEQWKPYNVNANIGELDGDLLHYTISSRAEHLRKIEHYSGIMAEVNFEMNKTVSIYKVLFSPIFKFFVCYIIKMGFLDGIHGYQISKISALACYMKYKKTRAYFQNKID